MASHVVTRPISRRYEQAPLAPVRRFVLLRQLVNDTPALMGLVLLSILIGMAVFAPWVAPYDPTTTDPLASLEGPSREHLLEIGRAHV